MENPCRRPPSRAEIVGTFAKTSVDARATFHTDIDFTIIITTEKKSALS